MVVPALWYYGEKPDDLFYSLINYGKMILIPNDPVRGVTYDLLWSKFQWRRNYVKVSGNLETRCIEAGRITEESILRDKGKENNQFVENK